MEVPLATAYCLLLTVTDLYIAYANVLGSHAFMRVVPKMDHHSNHSLL